MMGTLISYTVLGALVLILCYAWAKSERKGGADGAIKKSLQKAFRIQKKADDARAEPLDSGPELLDDWVGDVRDDGDS